VLKGLGGLFPQGGRLARLREVKEHQDGQSDDGCKSRVGAHRGNEVVHRESKWN
jgi:hypothetical protein